MRKTVALPNWYDNSVDMTDEPAPNTTAQNPAEPTNPQDRLVLGAARRVAGDRAISVRVSDKAVTLSLDIGGMGEDARVQLGEAVKRELAPLAQGRDVRVAMLAARKAMRIIAVGSGKGGVGKSTVATNLALALLAQGMKVGMVDADIYGPSLPRLLGKEDEKPAARDEKLVPVMTPHGIPLLSMGQLAKPGQAIAWRGPMAGRALDQLIDAHWGDVDTLVLDLPPGTGDVQLSIIQKHKPTGAVIVSTPQDLALIDAARAITLFRDASVPVIGMVENMAGYTCPHCGEVSDPFGSGGAEAEAAQLGLPFLGRIALDRSIRLASDAGVPPVAQGGDLAEPYHAIAQRIATWLTNQPV